MSGLDMTNKPTVEKWETEFTDAVSGALKINDLIGDTHDDVIYKPTATTGTAGNSTTVFLLHGGGKLVKGNYDSRLTKNDATKFAKDTVVMEQGNFVYDEGAKSNSIEHQKVPFSLTNAVLNRGKQDVASWLTCSFFAQLGGNAVKNEGDNDCDGFNPLSAPTNIVSGKMSMDLAIDAATMAQKRRMRPAQLASGASWVIYMSPTDAGTLTKEAEVGKNTWFDYQKTLAIAKSKDRELSTDFLGKVRDIEFRQNVWCPEGQAFLLGAEAVVWQRGEGFEKDFKTFTEILDGTIFHAKFYGVLGLKKAVFNEKDFGVVALKLGASGGGAAGK